MTKPRVGFSLSDYWLIVRKRKWVVILCVVIIFLSIVINTNMQNPVYKATCSIRVIERKSVSDMITQMVSYTSYDAMASLTKVLAGRPIIEKVVYELGLANEHTSSDELNNIISSIQGAVKVDNEASTNIVNITVESSNAQMAAKIANTVVKVYIKVDMEEKNELAHNTRVFIEDQADRAKQRLSNVENKIKVFREKGEAAGLAVAIENNIAALEKQKIELRKIYTEKYPDVLRIIEQISDLKEQLKSLPESELEYARLTREMEIDVKSYQLLQGKLDEARIAEAERAEDVRIVNPAMVPKSPIKPNKQAAAVLGFLISLVVGLFMAFIIETLDTSIGTIDELESLLNLPVLAVIPYMKPQIKEKGIWNWLSSWLWQFRALPESIEDMKQQMLIKYTQKSGTTEAYRILRTNIKVEELLKNHQNILLITSTIPKEGKSITSLNLALALSQDGYKTLLVDCDLRKAVLHKVFDIDKEPGLTDILLGSSKPETTIRNFIDLIMGGMDTKEALKTSGLDNFSLLTCGKIVPNPAELIDSSNIKELFASLKMQYDFIIVDSPPVLPVPDSIILGTKIANKLYLVYRSGYTSRIAILRAKEQVDSLKAVLGGVILNSTTRESQIVSDYYHHYYHYRYYAEKEEEKKQG
ncbi:MAG: GNVR domain-containing protein [Candidatus Omnitrophota bacterium]